MTDNASSWSFLRWMRLETSAIQLRCLVSVHCYPADLPVCCMASFTTNVRSLPLYTLKCTGSQTLAFGHNGASFLTWRAEPQLPHRLHPWIPHSGEHSVLSTLPASTLGPNSSFISLIQTVANGCDVISLSSPLWVYYYCRSLTLSTFFFFWPERSLSYFINVSLGAV